MAAGWSVTWTHCSVRYEVTWDKMLASMQTRLCVRADTNASERTCSRPHGRAYASTQTGSVHAVDAKGFGETT
jgi:hypothetical protein